jgi:thiamine kinase-like enzyme
VSNLTKLDDFFWVEELLKKLDTKQSFQGYYNHNYPVEHNGSKFILRVPIPNSATMDFRLIPEIKVLKFVEGQNFPAPRVLKHSKKFSVHSFIDGKVLHELYPRSEPFPDWIPINIAKQMKLLHQMPVDSFTGCPFLAQSPNTSEIFHSHLEFIQTIYKKYKSLPRYSHKFSQAFPENPFEVFRTVSTKLTKRNFVLSHCDIHRKNLILQENNNLVILDWELVLITDPCYDIAVHFHKMRYLPHQEDLFLKHYLELDKKETDFNFFKEQIHIHRSLEQVKSAIIDMIRYTEDFPGLSSKEQVELALHYQIKLNTACVVWGNRKFFRKNEILSLLGDNG